METQKKDHSNNKADNKDILSDISERSIKHLNWALGILLGAVGTFITLSLIIMGMLVFQNKKEYERALSEVNSAKEDIRYYRDEAQSATQKINDEGGRVIEAVQEKGDNAIIQIEKKSQEEIEKLKKQVLEQKEVFNFWIKVITDQDENAVLTYLEILEEKEPDNWLVYDYKGSIYYGLSDKIERDDEKRSEKEKNLLLKSKDCFIKSYSLHKGICVKDIIKICAKLDDEEGCKKWIKTGLDDNVISYKDIFSNSVSEIYRYASKDWFKEYSEKLKNKNKN
jgi:hypothetical protein